MTIQALTPQDLLRIVLKRKWWIFASLVICMALAYVAWTFFPKKFKSTVVVTIDSPRISKDYVKGYSAMGERPYGDQMAAAMQQVTLELTNSTVLMPVLDSLKPYPDDAGKPVDALMQRLRKSIAVARPKDGIGVAISFLHSEPHTAQAGAALLAVKLQEDNLKRRGGVLENTTEFLSAELDKMKAELEVKERAISDFKRAHMGELPQQMEANLRSLDRLQIDLTNSSDSLNKLGERLTALEKAIKEFSDMGPSVAVPFERDRRLGEVRPIDPRVTKLRELKQKLNELSATFKQNYPDIVHLKEEIRQLESLPAIELSLSGGGEPVGGKPDSAAVSAPKPADPYLRELFKERNEAKSEIAYLKEKQGQTIRQIRELEGRVERTPIREQSLAVLLRDYDNMQKGYQSLLDKRTSARILENYESRQFGEQYRIIEAANLPVWPEMPNQIHFLFAGFVVGCLIGFGSAIGVEFMKTGFRRPEEVEKYLGLPVIASIPSFTSATSGIGIAQSHALLTGPSMSSSLTVGTPSYLGYREKGVVGSVGKKKHVDSAQKLPAKFHLIAKWVPASLMAEQYRVAATRLVIMTSEKRNVVTLVTSSVMGEGKTTTAINLAYILAHDLGKSTLLIDCDFKRPMVHEYMGIPAGPGLGDVLHGGEILENCIHQCDGVPLWILPSGSPRVRPAGLSGIQHVKKILPELRMRYDHVILDAPPVMPLADVNVLSGMADMMTFVVRAGGTSQDIAKKALKTLDDTTDAAGIIMTQVEMEYAPYFMYAAAYTNEDSQAQA